MFANIGCILLPLVVLVVVVAFGKVWSKWEENGNGGYYDSSDVYYSNLVNTLIGSILVLIL